MDISFITNMGNTTLTNGFGVAGFGMITSLQRLGHRVPFADAECPVEIAFCQPDDSPWSNPDAYHIQYTPWESDSLPPAWVDAFNTTCDEVWTTSPLIGKWYEEAGVIKPITVYEHGLDPIWTPRRRRRSGPIKFLHIGEPAPRKGGQAAMEAFRRVFGDSEDVHLTIKAWTRNTIRVYKKGSILGLPQSLYKNVSMVTEEYTPDQMVTLLHEHDVLVYPSWGEGFGLIPLQALGTGMPTICTEAWAPYSDFLEPDLALGSTLVDSPWPGTHTGRMFNPSISDLESAMQKAVDDFDRYAGRAYRRSFDMHRYYNWDRLTEEAFAHIVKRFS